MDLKNIYKKILIKLYTSKSVDNLILEIKSEDLNKCLDELNDLSLKKKWIVSELNNQIFKPYLKNTITLDFSRVKYFRNYYLENLQLTVEDCQKIEVLDDFLFEVISLVLVKYNNQYYEGCCKKYYIGKIDEK